MMDTKKGVEFSNTWFHISNQGWRRMNAGRSLGHLVREAISNVFDAPGVTFCDVEVMDGKIVVRDDSPNGIADKSLVTTVFMTDKDDSCIMRGRKGRGLKELIAAGDQATVETVGYTVIFNTDGTRTVDESMSLSRGTIVNVFNKEWTGQIIDDCIAFLHKFIAPSHIRMMVNQKLIEPAKARQEIPAYLATTVIRDGKQIDEHRETKITIRNLRKGERKGWVYEMGIPVQEIGTKFHVDVQQRIPMNDNRDVVDSHFLPKLYAAILSGTIEKLPTSELRERWVHSGIYEADNDTSKKYASRVVPEGSVLRSTNDLANDKAKQHGVKLVDISMLPWEARWKIEQHAKTSEQHVKELDESSPIVIRDELRVQYGMFVLFMEWVAEKLTGEHHRVTFMNKSSTFDGRQTIADYDRHDRTVRFNVDVNFVDFTKPLSENAMSTMLHELAHSMHDKHDEGFLETVQELSGKMVVALFTNRAEIDRMMGGAKATQVAATDNRTKIYCQWDGCGNTRMVKPQDVHQTIYCVTHAKKIAKNKRSNRRQMSN